jgi:hypothetical protein
MLAFCETVISRYCPSISLVELRKTMSTSDRTVEAPVEIETGYVPNTSRRRYRLSQLALCIPQPRGSQIQ